MQNSAKLTLSILLTASVFSVSAAEPLAATCRIVRDGKPVATIVIAQNPSVAADFAAMELQQYIKKITGALLPVATDASE